MKILYFDCFLWPEQVSILVRNSLSSAFQCKILLIVWRFRYFLLFISEFNIRHRSVRDVMWADGS